MARERMPDIIVLLPGIMGSVLKKDGHDIWAPSGGAIWRAVRSFGHSLQDLAVTDDDWRVDDLGDGVTADRLMPDVHLIPGFWKIDAYTKVSDTLKQVFDVTENQNYFEFPYDWRRDNRNSALRLQKATTRWLADWRAQTNNPSAKLILIGHSMGGLVSRYFLEVLDGWKDTRALITFGTPYRGAVNAINALANGVKKGPFGLLDVSEFTRSLTSTYQLLPIYPCYDPGDGQLVRIGETTGIPNIDARRAADALAFHNEMTVPAEARWKSETDGHRSYETFPIVGGNQPTSQSAFRDGDGVDFLETYKGQDNDGDGTVPSVSATPIEQSQAKREMFAATKHASLQNADAVLAHIAERIPRLYLDLGIFRSETAGGIKLRLDIDDAYWPGEEITIRVQPNRDGPSLQATIVDTQSGNSLPTIPLDPAAEGWHQATIAPPPAGTYRITVTDPTGAAGATQPVEDVFAVLDDRSIDG